MFSHNHHPSRVKMVAKFIRRGIRVPDGHPRPPTVEGLPNDKWQWGKWPKSEPGYRNSDDPTDSVWSPHEGGPAPSGKEGEDPHWHERLPGEKGRGKVYPENPGWGRDNNDRDHPGVPNPVTGKYDPIVGTSPSISDMLAPFGVTGGVYIFYRAVRAIASPFCGPAAPVCAFAP